MDLFVKRENVMVVAPFKLQQPFPRSAEWLRVAIFRHPFNGARALRPKLTETIRIFAQSVVDSRTANHVVLVLQPRGPRLLQL